MPKMEENMLDGIRVASPCTASWESMSGTERARFCSECRLHVYDFSQLTRKEAVALVTSTQGRLCGRLHRRADGTILTRDCPVGLRAIRRRVARVAGASLTAVLSLFSVVGAQQQSPDKSSNQKVHEFTIERKPAPGKTGTINGSVVDPNMAVTPGLKVSLTDRKTKKRRQVYTSEAGTFVFNDLVSGDYDLAIEWPGFKTARLKKLAVKEGEQLTLSVVLQLAGEGVTVGLLVSSDDYESSNGTTTIKGDLIKKLPM